MLFLADLLPILANLPRGNHVVRLLILKELISTYHVVTTWKPRGKTGDGSPLISNNSFTTWLPRDNLDISSFKFSSLTTW